MRICIYVIVTESTTDVVFIGHSMAAENGIMLAENKEEKSGARRIRTGSD